MATAQGTRHGFSHLAALLERRRRRLNRPQSAMCEPLERRMMLNGVSVNAAPIARSSPVALSANPPIAASAASPSGSGSSSAGAVGTVTANVDPTSGDVLLDINLQNTADLEAIQFRSATLNAMIPANYAGLVSRNTVDWIYSNGKNAGTTKLVAEINNSSQTPFLTETILDLGNFWNTSTGAQNLVLTYNTTPHGGGLPASVTGTVTYGGVFTSTPISPGLTSSPGSLTGLVPSFSWTATSSASEYGLYISKLQSDGTYTPVFNSTTYPVTIPGNVTTYQLPAGILVDGAQYRWTMNAKINGAWSANSTALYFEALTAPTPISPGANAPSGPVTAGGAPRFTWSDRGLGASEFGLYIGKLQPGGTYATVFDSTDPARNITISGSSLSYQLPADILVDGGQYRWYMNARISGVWGASSDPLYFVYSNAPTLVSPGSSASPGSGASLAPSFSWTANASGVSDYGLYISKLQPGGTYASVFDSTTYPVTIPGAATSYQLPAGILVDNAYYRWTMNARTNGVWGTISTPLYFVSTSSGTPLGTVSATVNQSTGDVMVDINLQNTADLASIQFKSLTANALVPGSYSGLVVWRNAGWQYSNGINAGSTKLVSELNLSSQTSFPTETILDFGHFWNPTVNAQNISLVYNTTPHGGGGASPVIGAVAYSSGLVVPSATATIADRRIFYNNSAWDGNAPAANADDDAAIAPDKQGLLPGQTAMFANYTNYSLGLNGIMVDIANLANGGALTAADFTFKVGNSNDPTTWAKAPAPTTVLVRAGKGAGGSDRVELVWADNAIQKKWLQVTVLADPNTGLAAPDVFYLGNAVGDTGDSTTDAAVDSADDLGARAHKTGLAAADLSNIYDFNRDKHVDTMDELVAHGNHSGLSPLKLIAAPALPAALSSAAALPVVQPISAAITATSVNAAMSVPTLPPATAPANIAAVVPPVSLFTSTMTTVSPVASGNQAIPLVPTPPELSPPISPALAAGAPSQQNRHKAPGKIVVKPAAFSVVRIGQQSPSVDTLYFGSTASAVQRNAAKKKPLWDM